MDAKLCKKGKKSGEKCYTQTFDILIKSDLPWNQAQKLRDAVSVSIPYRVYLEVNRTYEI